jgi:hypothetical protein
VLVQQQHIAMAQQGPPELMYLLCRHCKQRLTPLLLPLIQLSTRGVLSHNRCTGALRRTFVEVLYRLTYALTWSALQPEGAAAACRASAAHRPGG